MRVHFPHKGWACLLLITVMSAHAQTAYRWIGKDGQVHYSDQPPPAAETRQFQQKKLPGNVIETSGPSYSAQLAAQKSPLTLYTSPNCVENCRIARDFLNKRGAPFSEKEIKTLEDLTAFKAATGSSEAIVPVLMAGTKVEKGFEENAWRSLLDSAGYPQDDGIPRRKAPTPAK
ncbi:MAG: glutaredoxin family protein [Betaproteobacteria bacterium]|nr:glutaredoxin family protein [Betaproteobacteria bacterium]